MNTGRGAVPQRQITSVLWLPAGPYWEAGFHQSGSLWGFTVRGSTMFWLEKSKLLCLHWLPLFL